MKPATLDLDCGYGCDHAEDEHKAFDDGYHGREILYTDPHLLKIYKIGESAGAMNRQPATLPTSPTATESALKAAKQALNDLPKDVPTNWLDPLLSGPNKVIVADFDCREIEALLRGIQDRLRAKVAAALAVIEALDKKDA